MTEPEPLMPDESKSKILTAEQVADIKRDCNRGVYLGHGSTITFCDSHEELRRQLEAKPSGALREENERMAIAIKHAIQNSIQNGCCIWCGQLEAEEHGTNYGDPCPVIGFHAALDARGAETTEER